MLTIILSSLILIIYVRRLNKKNTTLLRGQKYFTQIYLWLLGDFIGILAACASLKTHSYTIIVTNVLRLRAPAQVERIHPRMA